MPFAPAEAIPFPWRAQPCTAREAALAVSFEDHFSTHAAAYASYRPGCPARLIRYLASVAPGRRLAWDCGTGSGQAALALAAEFRRVAATDASEAQIANAAPHPRVRYHVARAERSPLPCHCADLAVAAQAVHWFDRAAFYEEARRVLRDGGVIAVWCYGRPRSDPAVDALIDRLCDEVVGSFWPPPRRLVDDGYASLEFPFDELTAPRFALGVRWDLSQLAGYVSTWSATRAYRRAGNGDPLEQVAAELASAWGRPSRKRPVRWPIHLRVGRIASKGR